MAAPSGFIWLFAVLGLSLLLAVPVASAAPAGLLLAFAESIVPAANDKPFCVDQNIGELFSRVVVDALHRRSRNVHLCGAFFLREPHQIDEANGLIFVHAHHDGSLRRAVSNRAKRRIPRQATHSAAFSWPWHIVSPHCSASAGASTWLLYKNAKHSLLSCRPAVNRPAQFWPSQKKHTLMRVAASNARLLLFVLVAATFALVVFAVVPVLFAIVAAGAVFAFVLLVLATAAAFLLFFFVAAAFFGSSSVMIWH